MLLMLISDNNWAATQGSDGRLHLNMNASNAAKKYREPSIYPQPLCSTQTRLPIVEDAESYLFI